MPPSETLYVRMDEDVKGVLVLMAEHAGLSLSKAAEAAIAAIGGMDHPHAALITTSGQHVAAQRKQP